MEMTARVGSALRHGGPGGMNSSMFTTPPAVVMVVCEYPGRAGGPGGIANGIPMARVHEVAGVSCTVTTFSALTEMVTGPSGVGTVSGTTTHTSVPGSQAVAALAGDATAPVTAPVDSPTTSRSDLTWRPRGLPVGLAGKLGGGCWTDDIEVPLPFVPRRGASRALSQMMARASVTRRRGGPESSIPGQVRGWWGWSRTAAVTRSKAKPDSSLRA